MKFLLSVQEVYRFDTYTEAENFIKDQKASDLWVLKKHDIELKEIKEKKEVVDTYYKVTVVKVFNDEKEPEILNTKLEYINN